MAYIRVIPCLLLANKHLVKTSAFKNPKYVGDPINAVKIFNDKEADELILLDIEASKQKKSPDFDLIAQIASEAFMPVAYGGGIKNLEHAKKIINSGVEKVIINSAAIDNISLITKIAQCLGSSSTVVSIDIKTNFWGTYKLFNPQTRKIEKKSFLDHISNIVNAGAGEIMLNDTSREGQMNGLNLVLVEKISKLYNLPLIISGGTGSLDHIIEARKSGASAVAVGSQFIYMGKHRAVMINYPDLNSLKKVYADG